MFNNINSKLHFITKIMNFFIAGTTKKKRTSARKTKKATDSPKKKSGKALEGATNTASESKPTPKRGEKSKTRSKAKAKRAANQPAWWSSLKRSSVAMENALKSASSDIESSDMKATDRDSSTNEEITGSMIDSLVDGLGGVEEEEDHATERESSSGADVESNDWKGEENEDDLDSFPANEERPDESFMEPASHERQREGASVEDGLSMGEFGDDDESDGADIQGEEGEESGDEQDLLSVGEADEQVEVSEGVPEEAGINPSEQEAGKGAVQLGTTRQYSPAVPTDSIVLNRGDDETDPEPEPETKEVLEDEDSGPRNLDLSGRDISWRSLDLLQEDVHRLFLLGDVMGALVSLERIVLVAGDRPHVRAFLARNAEKLLALYEQVFGGFDRVVEDSADDGPLGPNIHGPTLISEVRNAVDGERTMQEIMDTIDASNVECATVLHHMLRTRRVMFR